jgi:hypothetical protein|tara:strand:+ start:250 stop:477 length:228 start_codon:yes stop_codon:yes gene_type:complete
MNDTIAQLAELAMQSEMSIPIEWDRYEFTEQEIFVKMASNVLEQMEALPEDQRAVVAMATMTKLLVENFALKGSL